MSYAWIEGKAEFICLDSDPEWLTHRKSHITGSAVASIMGLSPFRDREQFLDEVLNGSDFNGNKATWWGSEMEVPNLHAFAKITGITVESHNGFYKSVEHPLMAATLDSFAWIPTDLEEPEDPPVGALKRSDWWDDFWGDIAMNRAQGTGLVEMKNTARVGVWSDTVPEYYWAQAQVQMFVTGLTWCVVCAKIGAADMRFHFIYPDEFFVAAMLEESQKFAEEAGIV